MAAKKKTTARKQAKGAMSQLDAAVQVLAVSAEPMSTKQMVEAMAQQKLWTSPAGKTPHATLYSAIQREIAKKGNGARFRKADRGTFALTTSKD